ncbi:MAG: BON domain-containing protein [Thermogutta sp.]
MSFYSPFDEGVVVREGRVDKYSLSPAMAEAERLAAQILRAVESATAGAVADLRVTVAGDCVILSGRCPSYYIKQKAQHAAMPFASGSLQNNIQVTWRR